MYKHRIVSLAWAGIAAVPALTIALATQADDATQNIHSALNATQVTRMAKAAASAEWHMPSGHFRSKTPKFSELTRTWTVILLQQTAPYIVDGDAAVTVNDKTKRVCVGQLMMPPPTCD